jgi:hypothetical protein
MTVKNMSKGPPLAIKSPKKSKIIFLGENNKKNQKYFVI